MPIATRRSPLALVQARDVQARLARLHGVHDLERDTVFPILGLVSTGDQIQDRTLIEAGGKGRPEGVDPVPKTLDWDKWLGVARERPYKNGIYHPFQWRAWQDFGTGPLGDFMCHIMDSPFKALELVL